MATLKIRRRRERTNHGEALGRRIKSLLDQRGWSQDQLARAAGLSNASVGNYIRGENYPRRPKLERIAAALGVSPPELTDGLPKTVENHHSELASPAGFSSGRQASYEAAEPESLLVKSLRKIQISIDDVLKLAQELPSLSRDEKV